MLSIRLDHAESCNHGLIHKNGDKFETNEVGYIQHVHVACICTL